MVPVFKKGRKVNNFDLYANHSWYLPGVKGMFVLLGWFLLGNLLASLLVAVFGLFVPSEIVMEYSMLVVYPLSFIPAMMYAAQKSQRNSLFETGYKLSSSHFGPYKGWQIALITIVLTYSFMMASDYPNYLNFKLTTQNGFMKQFYDMLMETLSRMTGGPFWSSFLLTAIFAPVFEEWLCRGMVLRGLLTKMKPAWAIVISALFFALIHMNPWQALNAFGIGLAHHAHPLCEQRYGGGAVPDFLPGGNGLLDRHHSGQYVRHAEPGGRPGPGGLPVGLLPYSGGAEAGQY